MTTDEWHNIMTLLTIIILADKRVYKEEVDTFVKTVKSLNESISPEIFMTEGMAFDWFKSNRVRAENLLVGPNVQRNLKDIIVKTRNVPGKSHIINAMQRIAQADSDFHKNEQSVIKRAAEGWGVKAA